MSRYHYLSDEELLASLAGQSRLTRAVEPEAKARFFVITCGEDLEEVSRFIARLNQIMPAGKSVRAYRLGLEGSVQIYLSFGKAVSTETVRAKLMAVCESDFTFHGSEEPYVLPLQPGFVWLNDDLTVSTLRAELSLDAAARKFLNDLKDSEIEIEVLDALTSPVVVLEGSAEVSGNTPAASEEVLILTKEIPALVTLKPVEIIKEVLPESEEALPSIPVDGGQQLLLFGIDQEVVRSELPKEVPRKTRSVAVTSAPAEDPGGFEVLKLFPGLEHHAAPAAKPKRRSTKVST